VTSRLADVARYAGVSEATVSRVLNQKPGVAKATQDLVLTALDVLGYERPTQLRGERARLVGLVLPELQNPIFPAFAEVVADGLAKRGFTPVLCTRTSAGISEADYVEMLLEHQVSGVIFSGGLYAQAAADHEHYLRLRERGLPAVLVNAAYEDLGFPRISVDDHSAVEQAFTHLRFLGHERIGMVLGAADHVPSTRKLAAFQALCAEHGTDPELVERGMFSMEGGQAAGRRLLRRGATSVICASDVLALGVIRAARRERLSVPDEISVIGFDDSLLMSCTDPPLTTVRQPIELMGRSAVSILMGLIGGAPVSSEELLFEPELVVRGSTGPAVAQESPRAVASSS
jgi:LacI family transcriptional regulator, repressor for deo operon, udp, cdd, tsx, nupC, and nupG